MLILSLSFSLFLLLLANLSVRRSAQPGVGLVLYALLGVFLPLLVGVFFPAVALQSILMPLAYGLWRWGRWPHGAFTALSCTTVVLAFLGAGLLRVQQGSSGKAWQRERYPYESMEARLPPVRPTARPATVPAVAASRLTEMEQAVQGELSADREQALRAIHEFSVSEFLDSQEFGVGRMVGWGARTPFWGDRRKQEVVRQPGGDAAPGITFDSPGDLPEVGPGEDEQFSRMHRGSVLDFVNPRGFGLVKDRRHVAGFLPHQFSQVPQPGERWQLERVELVSLLLHDTPRVYVSEYLPRMAEVRGVATRPLDAVETAGLQSLRSGEDLFLRPTDDGLRMLGSLRAVKQCVTCHEGQRGDLLGAFSYRLQPAKR